MALVVTYMDAVRAFPAKANTVKTYLVAISSTCNEFGCKGASPCSDNAVAGQLQTWLAHDGEESAEAFDMEADMKKMWGVVWTVPGWSHMATLQYWTMLLVAIAIFGRASELTEYCPTFEDTWLPESASQWDSDGIPKYIEIGLRNWKTRTECNRGKRYGMRLHRNYLDSRFCPVTWLLTWLHYSGITSGPLFQKLAGRDAKPTGENMTEATWTGATTKLFTAAGLYTPGYTDPDTGHKVPAKGVTNHGIRRSACQWAGRCHAREIDTANNGRWKTYTEMAKYMAQGAKTRMVHENDSGTDPIFSMWVWKPVTVASESTRNEL